MNNQECLRILKLDPSSNKEDLKLAYRKAVRHWHPDRYQQASVELRTTAEQQMQALNTAYTVLSRYYSKHGTMPGYIYPDIDDDSFSEPSRASSADYQHEATTATADSHKADNSTVQPDETVHKRRTTRRSQGNIWLILTTIFVLTIFFSGDYVYELIESDSTLSERDTPYESKKDPADLSRGQEADSPFASREKDSAFDRPTRKGLYDDTGNEQYFTYGDTAGRVFEIQGIPTRTSGDIWYYGGSEVHFEEGRVVYWYNAEGHHLKASPYRR